MSFSNVYTNAQLPGYNYQTEKPAEPVAQPKPKGIKGFLIKLGVAVDPQKIAERRTIDKYGSSNDVVATRGLGGIQDGRVNCANRVDREQAINEIDNILTQDFEEFVG